MSKRDYRQDAIKRLSAGEVKPLESAVFRLYANFSHRSIMSHAKRKEKLQSKIISLGNITFGGSGKTPFAEFFAQHFSSVGIKTGVALPGYKGTARSGGVLVSDGAAIKARLSEVGDEAIMLARDMLELKVPVYVHRNRISAAKELIKSFGCGLVILDDAFHFTSIAKDADICLVNALNPFGGGPLFAMGALREPPQSITRADAVIVTRRALAGEKKYLELEDHIRKIGFKGSIFSSEFMPDRIDNVKGGCVDLKDAPRLKVIPVSGIGNPDGFEKALRLLGLNFGDAVRFDDHHRYTQYDLNLIRNAIKEDKASGIITTSKDWVRFEYLTTAVNFPVYLLHSEVFLDDECLTWLDSRTKM